MGLEHFRLSNKAKPIIGKSSRAAESSKSGKLHPVSPSLKEDDNTSFTVTDDSFTLTPASKSPKFVMRTPPKRNCQISPVSLALAIARASDGTSPKKYPADPFKPLSSTRKHHVNRAPDPAESFGEKNDMAEKSRSLPHALPLVTTCGSSLSSLTQSRSTSSKDVGQPLHTKNKKGIKEKIDLYESWSHEKKGFDFPGDFDHNSVPTMKLRATYLNDSDPSHGHDVTVSPGHKLSLPKGLRKHRKVRYRIRYAMPEAQHTDCDNIKKQAPMDKDTSTRGGGIRGIRGYNRSNNWITWDEPEELEKSDRSDESGSLTNSETTDVGYCDFYRPPDVWITPFKADDGSQKWITKRVWDMEDRDDEEPEYEVDHQCLMHGIRGLMGIPEKRGLTSEEWAINIDNNDPWEKTDGNDAIPNVPNRNRDESACLLIQRIIECEDSDSESFDDLCKQLVNVVNFPHLEEVGHSGEDVGDQSDKSVLSDSHSNTSLISGVDYFDFDKSETSSAAVSLATYGTEDDSHKVPKPLRTPTHNERGYGRPDDWVRSNDAYEKSSNEARVCRHNERGYGRPDEWVRPNDAYENSANESRVCRHNKRGYGRPDDWVRPKDIITDADGSKNPSVLTHSEKGFGRPDGWVRPHDVDDASESTESFSESVESLKHRNHNERGFGRPDGWVRPQNVYDESSEYSGNPEHSKRVSHSTRGFGRPDGWLRPSDSPGASTECRSCGSPLSSRTKLDKPPKRESVSENSQSEMTLNDWLSCSEHTKKMKPRVVEAKMPRRNSLPLKSTIHTHSIRVDPEDEYKRGTPTWEKIGLQQEVESNIKLWWQY